MSNLIELGPLSCGILYNGGPFDGAEVPIEIERESLGCFYTHRLGNVWHHYGSFLTEEVRPGDNVVIWLEYLGADASPKRGTE